MRSRKHNPENESLDLLLDTITNTFGGLIFIAILIALLVGNKQPNATRSKTESQDDSLIESKMTQLDQMKSQYGLLKQQADSRKKFVAALSTPNQRQLLDQHKKLKSKLSGFQSDNQKLSGDNDKLADANYKKSDELQSIDRKLRMLQSESEQLEGQLSNEKSKRTVTIDSPRAIKSTKPQVAIVVRNKQIYYLHDFSGSFVLKEGNQFEKTSKGMEEIEHESGYYRMKADGGYSATDIDRFRNFLRRIDSKRFDVALCIFEDSFGAYKPLRDGLVAHNLRHAPTLLDSKNGKIIVSPNSSSQDVQ